MIRPRDGSEMCATCIEQTGTQRYCAPARCYCGHDACPAEWHPLPDLREVDPAPAKPARASSWGTREDSTWIDKM